MYTSIKHDIIMCVDLFVPYNTYNDEKFRNLDKKITSVQKMYIFTLLTNAVFIN